MIENLRKKCEELFTEKKQPFIDKLEALNKQREEIEANINGFDETGFIQSIVDDPKSIKTAMHKVHQFHDQEEAVEILDMAIEIAKGSIPRDNFSQLLSSVGNSAFLVMDNNRAYIKARLDKRSDAEVFNQQTTNNVNAMNEKLEQLSVLFDKRLDAEIQAYRTELQEAVKTEYIKTPIINAPKKVA